jgi:hypothetical protein
MNYTINKNIRGKVVRFYDLNRLSIVYKNRYGACSAKATQSPIVYNIIYIMGELCLLTLTVRLLIRGLNWQARTYLKKILRRWY